MLSVTFLWQLPVQPFGSMTPPDESTASHLPLFDNLTTRKTVKSVTVNIKLLTVISQNPFRGTRKVFKEAAYVNCVPKPKRIETAHKAKCVSRKFSVYLIISLFNYRTPTDILAASRCCLPVLPDNFFLFTIKINSLGTSLVAFYHT